MMAREDSPVVGWLRALGACLGLSGAIAFMFAARAGFHDFLVAWAVSALYTVTIGGPAALVFRWLGPRFARVSELVKWLVALLVLFALSALGALAAGLVQVAVGLMSMDTMWGTYVVAVEIGCAIAVPMTAGAVSYAGLRRRIGEREAQLHDTELERQRALGLAAEARLASLESRIRPHFLFNALNSAIALIPEDPARAEAVLERLAALLRFSLDAHGSRLVPLGEELRVVTDYLEIERVRFGERLRFAIEAAEALASWPIPAFAIQTLVENSVKYAVAASPRGAAIAVRARRDGEGLAIDVTDDGPGLGGAAWPPGHGLDVLRGRLDALYGARARLVAPPAPGGAVLRIELPAPAAAAGEGAATGGPAAA